DPCRFIQVLSNGEGGRVAQVSIARFCVGAFIWRALFGNRFGRCLRVLGVLGQNRCAAQESAPDESTDAEPGDADTPETGDDTAEGPQLGQSYVAATFTDWSLTCVVSGTGNDPCRFIQVLSNGEGGRVAQVSIVPLPPGQGVVAAAIVETPLGTLLRVPQTAEQLEQPGGLRIQVDSGELRVFQFTFCGPDGCVAEIGMEQGLVDAFKRGNTAKITIWSVDAPGQPVELDLSLAGFTAGFDRVSELAAGAAPAE
ncbi:MAG: invasion associated locus B family protein, partial [Pseudomonadota bacterium]